MSERPKIVDLLREWGRWERSGGGPGLDITPQSVFGLGSTVKQATITDEAALGVNRAVAELGMRRPATREVIYYVYVWGKTTGSVAKDVKMSRTTVRGLLQSGEAWLEARLLD